GHGGFCAIEPTRRAGVRLALGPRHLTDTPIARKRAVQDHQSARRLYRPIQWADNVLARRLLRQSRLLAERTPAHRHRVRIGKAALYQTLGDQSRATRAVQVGRRVATPRPHVAEQWCAAADAVEVVHL